jgi:hypothetical protein
LKTKQAWELTECWVFRRYRDFQPTGPHKVITTKRGGWVILEGGKAVRCDDIFATEVEALEACIGVIDHQIRSLKLHRVRLSEKTKKGRGDF